MLLTLFTVPLGIWTGSMMSLASPGIKRSNPHGATQIGTLLAEDAMQTVCCASGVVVKRVR